MMDPIPLWRIYHSRGVEKAGKKGGRAFFWKKPVFIEQNAIFFRKTDDF